jgi:hypothetical protein
MLKLLNSDRSTCRVGGPKNWFGASFPIMPLPACGLNAFRLIQLLIVGLSARYGCPRKVILFRRRSNAPISAGWGQDGETISSDFRKMTEGWQTLGVEGPGHSAGYSAGDGWLDTQSRLIQNDCPGDESTSVMQLVDNNNAAVRPVVRGLQYHQFSGRLPHRGSVIGFPFLDDSAPYDNEQRNLP